MKSLFKLVLSAIAVTNTSAWEGEEVGKPDKNYCAQHGGWKAAINEWMLKAYSEGAEPVYYMARPISKHLRFMTAPMYRKEIVNDEG